MINIDRLIIGFDRGLRTLFARAQTVRPVPGDTVPEAPLDERERTLAASLMRVNHTGEICAQALYEGQALSARDSAAKGALERAAQEETEHLAWTEHRIEELGGRKSVLNPLFYTTSFAIGVATGLLGDRWNLGFLAETERQVVEHLSGHLERLPAGDEKSRAILEQMREDEGRHATSALDHGGGELPEPAKRVMRFASGVMTRTAFWI